MTQRPELPNPAPRTYALEWGWLGDHPTRPSHASVVEDAELLAEVLALRISYHPASTYTFGLERWHSGIVAIVVAAIEARAGLVVHLGPSGVASVRARRDDDAPASTAQPIKDIHGLDCLLAESVDAVLSSFAQRAGTTQQLARKRPVEIQGLLFTT